MARMKGNAAPVGGEQRWTVELVGCDGQRRTTNQAGKLAEAHYLGRVSQILTQVKDEDFEEREADYLAFRARMDGTKSRVREQEIQRDAVARANEERADALRKVKQEQESGVVKLRVYEDLGPVWTRRWLKDEIGVHVPEIMFCELNVQLTCKALQRATEIYRERRRKRILVRDPAAFIVEVATAWQLSRPTVRLPLHEALLCPERIAPSL